MGPFMSAPYSPEETSERELVRISIRLEEHEARELQKVADIWEKLDASLGTKRRYKWSAAAVMERMIRVGMADFWMQIGGAQGEDETDEELVRRAIANVKKSRKTGEPK